MSDQNCLFCKIINKEIPKTFVYESNEIVAFLDINPVNFGHLLVLPKKHSVDMLDTDDHLLGDIAVAVKKLAPAMIRSTGAGGFNVEVNNGLDAGQIIAHAHWHLIPRFENDGLKHWPSKKYAQGEEELMVQKIKTELNA